MKKILLGLDIGSQNIKAVQLVRERKEIKLLAAGYIPNPIKSQSGSNISEPPSIKASINRLIHDMKLSSTDTVISLPSAKVITRVIQLPILTEKELAKSIPWEAEQFIPLPLDKVKMDYTIVETDETNKTIKVMVAAAPLELVNNYVDIVTDVGLIPVAVEPEILSVVRSVVASYSSISNMLIITIGEENSEIGLLHQHLLIFSKTLPVGGRVFTQTIAQELGFELSQAEEYKKTYGLEEDKLEGKVAKILLPYISNIITEIEKTITFFKEQYPKEELNTIIIDGGSAKLPGLMLSITKNLGIDSQIANPFVNLSVDPNILPIITPDAPIYSISVGLALKEVD